MGVFLQVNKDYMGLGLKSVDLLIISQVEEFTRNRNQCYVTNKQFSDMFGESESSIKRAIDKLVKANIIHRDTIFVQGNGRANKQRVLNINSRKKWKVQNDLTKKMEGSNFEMEGSKSDDGRFKNDQWKGQNDPIKDNKNINKIKIKYNSDFVFDSDSDFGFGSDSNLSSNYECEKEIPMNKKRMVVEMFNKGGVKYNEMAKETGLSYNQVKEIINGYKANRDDYLYEPPTKKEIRYISKDGKEYYLELADIKRDLETKENGLKTKEENLEAKNKCLKEYYDSFIENGADKNYVYNFFKAELNYTPEEGYKDLSEPIDSFCDDMSQLNQCGIPNNKNKGINRFIDDDEIFG